MNIFHKVTLQSLKENKTRTVVTIIGIILSAAMICAVTTFASSIRNYALQNMIYTTGDWHGNALSISRDARDKIAASEEVAGSVYNQQLGYAIANGCQNQYKPYLYVIGAGPGFEDTMPVHISSGTFPKAGSEILLPDHLAENGGVVYQIGDSLTLELGNRMLDGFPLGQNNPCYFYDESGQEIPNDETLQVRESRTYTVVGFYERFDYALETFSAPGYTAITLADTSPADTAVYDVYFKMRDVKTVYEFISENELSGTTNTDVLMYSGASQYSSFYSMLYGFAAIVIGLIMFGSISLIYNAFSISVSERTRQFGLLSSIGATKKQLRKMVFFEALTVSSIGIPLGIGAGVAGISITLLLIGNKFTALGTFPIPMRVCISPASIIVACAVALITVLISAWIPSRRATKVSAVEAIRQNTDIRVKTKQIRTSGLTYKLFGLPGVLASKHYKRSRKKYRTTVVSLFMSVVLFISASAFTEYLMEAASGSFSSAGYDINFFVWPEDLEDLTQDELLEEVLDAEAVTNGVYLQGLSFHSRTQKAYLTSDYIEKMDSYASVDDILLPPAPTEADLHTFVLFVSDAQFQAVLKTNGLSEELYMDPTQPRAVAVDGAVVFNYDTERYETVYMLDSQEAVITISLLREFEGYTIQGIQQDEAGNSFFRYTSIDESEVFLDIPALEAYDQIPLQTAAVIHEAPFFLDSRSGLTLLYPQSLKSVVFPSMDLTDSSTEFCFTSATPAASYDALRQTLEENGIDNYHMTNYAEQVEQNRNIVTIITVFSYGFIILISLIAAANVFNTISTNIGLRRREFAMLKSVGMSKRGFNLMMNYECLLYGSKALLYGLPVSTGITYLIWLTVSEGYATTFRLPWGAMRIAALSVFSVVFATMLYAMGKIKKDNPIDALKNENL